MNNENMRKFYKDISNEWFMLNSIKPVSANEVKSELLRNNSFITIDRIPLNHGQCYRNGIIYVNYLLDKNERII